MAKKKRRYEMERVREVLRLKFELNNSDRDIAKILCISKTTVKTYVSRAVLKDIKSYQQVIQLNDTDLLKIIFPEKNKNLIPIDFQYIQNELDKHKYSTLQLIWKEENEKHQKYYAYSYFCKLYRRWIKHSKITLRKVYKPGEHCFIDYAGTTVPIKDERTGIIRDAQLFVSVLGFSNYTFAEVTWTQKIEDFISSNINMVEYYGGVPEILVPDNLKSGVTKSSKYEPIINKTYLEFSRHYKTTVIPARVRKPKDKAKVEGGVLIASRSILAALRNRTFFSLEEANRAIKELLTELNNQSFQKMEGSRQFKFDETEKGMLKPLPVIRFANEKWEKSKVGNDYHVEFEKCFYSVPYKFRNERVMVRGTSFTVEIFYQNDRIASHNRIVKKGNVSTQKEHMPTMHQELYSWNLSNIQEWASVIGVNTLALINGIIDQASHPNLALKSCLGIINLEKKYGKVRMELASKKSVYYKIFSYKKIKDILDKGLDLNPILFTNENYVLPENHENIRGAYSYQ